jgi:hypothetical protein
MNLFNSALTMLNTFSNPQREVGTCNLSQQVVIFLHKLRFLVAQVRKAWVFPKKYSTCK